MKGREFLFWNIIQLSRKNIKNDEGSLVIKLKDKKSGNDIATTNPAGIKKYALIDVTHDGKKFSTYVTKIQLLKRLNGFEFIEQERGWSRKEK